ncbi:hypothetical protein C5B90_05885 [Haloferax sp. Atlit-12N]|uniref:hypothetical protein n=1 Tax=Haloferax sp. Atlit-12N TaxID=2077203 RepID=UPI000E242CDA|nr:hypothetical protein [Haloferax sp. Atlit-12N]RDZ65879.1 hypothetical protein C5B90_05885 [Haloferax sp. Atlit-12N]
MSILGSVAGGLDHLAGSVDESIGRQFDDEPGGGFADVGRTGETNDSETDTYNNRYLRGDFARSLYDTVTDYDGTLNGQEDTVDLLGPGLWGSEGSAVDVVVERDGEEHGTAEMKTKLLLAFLAALVVLYLVAPLLELILAVGGDGE